MTESAGDKSSTAVVRLRGASQAVLSRWRKSIADVLPGIGHATAAQLEAAIPRLLERMAQVLEAGAAAPTAQLLAESPVAGFRPSHPQFSLSELIIEHHLLRRAVLEDLSNAMRRPLRTEETIAIDQVIDVALRQTATAYADDLAQRLHADATAASSFLSFVSHDLRGGINGAMLMIEVLRREMGDDQRFASLISELELVRSSLADTVKMMERYVDAEKLRHGRLKANPAPVKLAPLLRQIHKNVSYHLRQQEMTLSVSADEQLTVTSDTQLLSMVLQNLVDNAIKHGRRGNIELTAAQPAELPTGIACRISVMDQGPGIAPEKLARLMRPLEPGATYGQKDVGLGLFIARRGAELLGATLTAQSQPGRGATFHLDLPKHT